MGTIVQYHCNECHFDKKLLIGGGLNDCKIRTMLDALGKNEQSILLNEIRHGASRISIIRKPCVCSSCGMVQTIAAVSYHMGETEKRLFGSCNKCGQTGNEAWMDAGIENCPCCGRKLEKLHVGHWD